MRQFKSAKTLTCIVKLVIVFIDGLLPCVVASNQLFSPAEASYQAYVGYSSVDFDAVPGVFVPFAADCVALSTVSPLSNGVVYNDAAKSCKLLTAFNNDIVVTLRANASWTTYVKDISASTRLLFKVASGINSDNAGQMTASIFDGSLTGSTVTSTYTEAVATTNKTASCMCNYRNAALDKWSSLQFSTIIVQTMKNGLIGASFVFGGSSNINSWFSLSNLLGAYPYNYQQMRLTTFALFNYKVISPFTCTGTPTTVRSFTMNAAVSTCNVDTYYLVATQEVACCASVYGISGPYPIIYYSYTLTAATLAANVAIGKADFLLVSAKITSRVVFIN